MFTRKGAATRVFIINAVILLNISQGHLAVLNRYFLALLCSEKGLEGVKLPARED